MWGCFFVLRGEILIGVIGTIGIIGVIGSLEFKENPISPIPPNIPNSPNNCLPQTDPSALRAPPLTSGRNHR